jgi:NADH-quinone oxidoreductase subunit L
LILLIPLLSAVIIAFVTRRNKDLSSYISIGAVVITFILSIEPIIHLLKHPHMTPIERSFTWVNVPGLYAEIGTLLDPLSILMLFVVTFVGSLIHIYSRGYMHGESGFSRFFACLSIFIFSMLGIVLANNFVQMYIFWELVGLSSYLLIGYYFEKESAADAAKKAFLVNRIGDFGFMIGILVIFYATGTFNFLELQHILEEGHVSHSLMVAGALLVFCGTIGKSAQFPLHVWLPDAMEGPTPVSALIHAATMVAAGVYLLARTFFIFVYADPIALEVVAYIGGLTCLMAAIIAIAQNDIKRIIAYSTLSSLGYMVMAIGVGGMTAGMFYLTTHAFFKALLFLAAGSAIHAVHSNDIWDMGGLSAKMKITTVTFLIGALALAGVFPFSGFWSKDEILGATIDTGHYLLWFMGSLAAFLTAFYMARLFFVAFLGKPRTEESGHAHESPASMTIPLMVLAAFAALGGFAGLPEMENNFASFIHAEGAHHGEFHISIALFSTVLALVGIALGWLIYARGSINIDRIKSHWVHGWVANKFYFDEFYDNIVVGKIYNGIGKIFNFLEVNLVINFFVNGFAFLSREIGKLLRQTQTGLLHNYAFIMVMGVVVLLFLFVMM